MSRAPALLELEEAWRACRADPEFVRDLRRCLATHAGRPTPLTRADRLAGRVGGGLRIYLKREDLTPTGTHKINNGLGQALLARHMGKTRLVAGTRTGQHGVAVASAAALLRLRSVIYMGEEDARRRPAIVSRMRLMGADVVPVPLGSRPREEADLEARRDWTLNLRDTYYLPGFLLAEPPYPSLVRDFQSVIGHEARSQIFEAEGTMPDTVVAWVGGDGSAIGLFQAFLDDRGVRMFGVGAPVTGPSTGLDDAAGPLLSRLRDTGRVLSARVGDEEALAAVRLLAETEGIQAAPESAHALAFVARQGPPGAIGQTILIGLPGRSDREALPVASEAARLTGEQCR